MNTTLRNAVGVVALAIAAQAAAEITFYEGQGFKGRSFTTQAPIGNFERLGFNDRASSAVVGRDHWELCENAGFRGRCVVLRPGRYASLKAMGLDNRVSSARATGRDAVYVGPGYASAPAPVPAYNYHPRENERLYEANVTFVRAVVGPPEQRCWVEREQLVQNQDSGANVPAAIAGAVIGGIIGHQIGNGRGNDVATAGGAVAGAAIGANIGRGDGGQQVVTRDVQRCAAVSNPGRPAYWDVTYVFRGREYRMQSTAPPGPTVTVNARGEPRG